MIFQFLESQKLIKIGIKIIKSLLDILFNIDSLSILKTITYLWSGLFARFHFCLDNCNKLLCYEVWSQWEKCNNLNSNNCSWHCLVERCLWVLCPCWSWGLGQHPNSRTFCHKSYQQVFRTPPEKRKICIKRLSFMTFDVICVANIKYSSDLTQIQNIYFFL